MKKGGPRPGSGRPAHEPTNRTRYVVEVAVACGMSHEDIALAVGVSLNTLKAHYATELEAGSAKVTAKVGRSLVRKALKGDTGAIIWFSKNRMGWRDTTRTELTGANGGPVQVEDVTQLSDEELEAIVNGDSGAKTKGCG
jgi:hypothetical protein